MKKIFLFLLAVLFVAACSGTPKITTVVAAGDDEEEEVAVTPEWMKEMIETHNRNMEEKKKKEEEIKKWFAEKKPAARPATEQVNKIDCKINKHDCWDVVKLFTPAAQLSEEELNKKLKKLGLEITNSIMYRDGGSRSITLSDGTLLHIANSLWDRSHDITIKLTDGRTVKYDTEGRQIKPIK